LWYLALNGSSGLVTQRALLGENNLMSLSNVLIGVIVVMATLLVVAIAALVLALYRIRLLKRTFAD